jgi:uncharacterized membrane protein HdeD (DUF308 family)
MQHMNHAADRAGVPRYPTLRRYVGGILATAGIFAVFFGVENLTGSRVVSLALLIAGVVSVVFGLKLRGRSRPFSGRPPKLTTAPPDKGRRTASGEVMDSQVSRS